MSFRKLEVDKYDEDGALMEKEEISALFFSANDASALLPKFQQLKREVQEHLARYRC
jgi:hypothetical protein